MLHEQAMQMTCADAQPRRHLCHAAIIEHTFLDQSQAAAHDAKRAQPGRRAWRRFRAAAQTGTESCLGGSGGSRVVANVRPLRVPDLAHRATVDSRGSHGNEEFAVKPGIATGACAIERPGIEAEYLFHGARIGQTSIAD